SATEIQAEREMDSESHPEASPDVGPEMERLTEENEELKLEIAELRAEMDEMRDSFFEEDTRQLQEVRRDLERANKSCRILQYRLRKTERRRERSAQSGEADEELVRGLEQDLKVAKDVSVRLHRELQRVEEAQKLTEQENDRLRENIVQLQVSRQALLNQETTLLRNSGKIQHNSELQEDSKDLRCHLSLMNEEAELLRKNMVTLAKEKEKAEQQVQQYLALYGELLPPPPQNTLPHLKGEMAGPPSMRESELKLRLRLVEEEADALSRKIVELELESRGLRAELSDMREEEYGGGVKQPGQSELREQLLLLEEEVELLRRSNAEAEQRNIQITEELITLREGGTGAESTQEELRVARKHLNSMAGKLLQLQAEKQQQLSAPRPASDIVRLPDSHTDVVKSRDPNSRQREGPIGGESDSEETRGTRLLLHEPGPFKQSRQETIGHKHMMNIHLEAERLGGTIEQLISETNAIISIASRPQPGPPAEEDSGSVAREQELLQRINGQMKGFQSNLHGFMQSLQIPGSQEQDPHERLSVSDACIIIYILLVYVFVLFIRHLMKMAERMNLL
uniref:SOGA coiled-coil domain-containing protein n=1 Tax=Denticeps clupeoides TaxID=299321 RepID=A0AAY4CB37_9TELE